ncbi:HNH endonuclease [Acidovorax sp. Root219]|nr:HNH endonuclease [Acidovorax sp. Root219]
MWLAIGAGVLLSTGVQARIPRSSAVVAEFKRLNPCPVNAARRGPCPGHQVDHIVPLCAGGADHVENLQWLTVQQHSDKTRFDVLLCRKAGKLSIEKEFTYDQ